MKILAISGSLRKDSYNTALARAMQELAPAGMEIELADISTLPLYNQDLEAAFPAEAAAFKEKVEAADGIIMVTPEYNRSVPPALSNAIDWASRPWGKSSWAGKQVLTAGVTVGKTGTTIGQSHLRHMLLYLDMRVLGQPELYFNAGELFDASGALVEGSRDFIAKALGALAARIGA